MLITKAIHALAQILALYVKCWPKCSPAAPVSALAQPHRAEQPWAEFPGASSLPRATVIPPYPCRLKRITLIQRKTFTSCCNLNDDCSGRSSDNNASIPASKWLFCRPSGSHTCSSEHTCQQLQMLSHLLSTANNSAASSVPASHFICKVTDVPTQKHPLQAAPHSITVPVHLLNSSSCLYSRDVICYPLLRDYTWITLLYIILYSNIQKSRWLLVCAGSKSFSCIKGEEKSKLCLQWTPLTSLPHLALCNFNVSTTVLQPGCQSLLKNWATEIRDRVAQKWS